MSFLGSTFSRSFGENSETQTANLYSTYGISLRDSSQRIWKILIVVATTQQRRGQQMPLLLIQEWKTPLGTHVNTAERRWREFVRVPRVGTCHRLGDRIASCRCTRHLRPVGETRRQCSCVTETRLRAPRKTKVGHSKGARTREQFVKVLKSCALLTRLYVHLSSIQARCNNLPFHLRSMCKVSLQTNLKRIIP